MNAPIEDALTVAAVQGVEAANADVISSNVNTAQTSGLYLTFYPNDTTTTPSKSGDQVWTQFAERLTKHEERPNKSGPAFSPVRLKAGGKRKNDDVEVLTAGVADSDKGAAFDAVVARFEGLAAAIYTTHSHTLDLGKCRAVVPFSRPVDRADWATCRAGLVDRFGDDIFDPATKDASRIYYLPSCPAENVSLRRAVVLEGKFLDPAPLIARGRQLLTASSPKLTTDQANINRDLGYQIPERVEEGQRNTAVLKYVNHLRGSGMPEKLMLEPARDFNRARCNPPLDDDEVTDIVSRYAISIFDDPAGWPDPKPIDAHLPDVKPFNLDLLPTVFRPYVEDQSELMQVVPDFIAAPLMVAAAAAIGNGIAIAPKALDTSWLVSPVLWGGVVGRPGQLKSPAIANASHSLSIIEAELQKVFDQQQAQYAVGKLAYVGAMKKAAAAAANGKPFTPPIEPVEPKPERIVVNDSTAQMLGEILRHSPRGVLVLRDELVALLEFLAAEGQEGSRGFYLEGWNGLGSYRIDRVGRGSFMIPRLALWVFGGIQPGRLQAYIRQATNGGNGDDGLMQRFQMLVWPETSSKPWQNIDRVPDFAALQAVEDTFKRLRGLDPVTIGAHVDDLGTRPAYLHFTSDAQDLFNTYRSKQEKFLRGRDQHPALESHFSKYRSLIPALALVIHLADGGTGPVCRASLTKAIVWSGYLWSHAQRVYASVTNSAGFSAKALAVKIANGSLNDGFTAREVRRHGWAHLGSADDVKDALEWLVDAGWLRMQRAANDTGGRPTDLFNINPKVQRK